MERELIPLGEFQGIPAVVLDGTAAGSIGPDWMRDAAGTSQGPFLLRRVPFPASDLALERLVSSREETPLVWREAIAGEGWPSTPVWTALDVSELVRSAGLDPATMRTALGDLPPMGQADELVVRTVVVSAVALDELHAWMSPRSAWLVVPAADVPGATRVVSKTITQWGVRAD